ncbi:protein senC [Oceanicola sp. 22II-s10i]|uniref:SCO family protein n=1 Tax=Oceanicola sp. 22II-s10i TaxID=1317116 RepID=UPI000B526F46|nr:SCO family protein [Oceanicola sp. 22II-s10i]OWU85962.1 protein senC [Oceanicola sp. 22II-s10i]
MTRTIAILAGTVMALFLAGIYVFTLGRSGDDKFAQCRASSVAGGAATIGGPFTLVDEDGQTVTDKDVLDQPALIYFGYTYCPDVCPMDTARNAQAITLLEERGSMVKPVFITIDPARDTPEQLKDFTDYLHPRMVGLTGTEDQVNEAKSAYRAFGAKAAGGDPDYYLMDHSTFTYLTTPEDGFLEFFRRETTAEDMADRVQCFLDAR